ncbi:MAG: hypothetical protein R2754_04970 [Microthrixaceae bacterium]
MGEASVDGGNPRLQRATLLAMVLLLAGTLGAGIARSGGDQVELAAAGETPRRIVVITAPRLVWDDLNEDLPNLRGFASEAVIASTSVRTLGPITDPAEAYLTLGAGNRAGAPPASALLADGPGLVYGPEEQVAGQSAADLFEARTGNSPSGAAGVVTDIGALRQYNDDFLYNSEVGNLGDALAGKGRVMGALGNADVALEANGEGATNGPFEVRRSREVGLMAMTSDGLVAQGAFGPTLLEPDTESPGGVRLSPEVVRVVIAAALEETDVMVVELSDLERAQAVAASMSEEEAEAVRNRALQTSDEVLGEVLAEVDATRDLVLLLTPDSPTTPPQLGVFAAQGPGLQPGWAKSATTRRPGYVTLTDIAPSILAAFDIEAPDGMPDTRLIRAESRAGGGLPLDRLDATNNRSVCVLETHDPAAGLFVVLSVLLVIAAAALRQYRPRLARHLSWPALTLMTVPAMSFFLGAVGPLACVSTPAYMAAMMGASGLLAAVVMALTRARPVAAPVAIAAFGFLVLVVDLWFGGWLQMDTVFGYSPQVAGRFAGLGNLAFALLTYSALVLATVGRGLVWPRREGAPWDALAAVFLLGIVTVIVDGHPVLGSDVGGVLALVPAFSVVLLSQSGHRLRLRNLAIIGVGTVAVLLAFGAIDLSRPPEQRTHLGRFLESVANGDAGVILARKINANLSILTSSVWALLLPAAAVLALYLATRPNSPLAQLRRHVNGLSLLWQSALVAAVLGAGLNDSGVAIVGLVLAVAVPMTLYLVFHLDQIEAGYPEPNRSQRAEDEWPSTSS